MSRAWLVPLAALAGFAAAPQAFGWGSTGHRLIGTLAVEALPPDLPAFLRDPSVVAALGEQSREPDRSRHAGKAHDADRDPGHFVDGDDNGKIGGAVAFEALPATREEYDTALRAAGTDSWQAGYLPYSIIEDWQQLAKDFAYWRADKAAAVHTASAEHRAWFDADRHRREAQIVDDLGALSHFVGDGSMPLHASIHHDGWGPYPNPAGYTEAHVHVPWEGLYVRHTVTKDAVRAAMSPLAPCACPIEQRVGAYLAADARTVIPFYDLEKAGAFATPDPKGVAFTTARVAAGASELRDEIVMAWAASAAEKVGYPEVDLADIESGKIDPYDNFVGLD